MKEKFFDKYADEIEALSRDMAKRFLTEETSRHGQRRQSVRRASFTVEFTHPIIEKRAAFPVIPLMTDIATMTAIGNDIDFSRVFVNQLRLLGAARRHGAGRQHKRQVAQSDLRAWKRRAKNKC